MSFNGQYEYKIEIDTVDDAKKIVSIATKLKGKIVLKSDSKFSVNAKSLLGVMSLGIQSGAEIEIEANGDDEKEAIETLKSHLKNPAV